MTAARSYFSALCARSEQCAADLRDKMWRRGLTSAQIASLLSELREAGFIDDARFCRAFTHDKTEFGGWGLRKINLVLRQKKMPEQCIAEAFDSIDRDRYESIAMNVARGRARGRDLNDAADRRRLFAALIQRGFESQVATNCVKRLRMEMQSSDRAD